MSDEDLRELERRFRATGSVEDEAEWLLQRLRAGELGESELGLAAYCGHEAARQSLGSAAPAIRTNPRKFALRLPARLSRDASLRAALSLGELAIRRRGRVDALLFTALLWTTRALLRQEPIESAHEAWVAATGNSRVIEIDGIDIFPVDRQSSRRSPVNYSDVLSEALDYVEGLGLIELSLAAMREDLIPWALGYSDPVRERLEARLGDEAVGE